MTVPRRWRAGLALGAVLVLAAWSSVTTVPPGHRGVVVRFGEAARVVGAGLRVTLPWPVERVEAVDTELSRLMPVGYRLVDEERGIGPSPEITQWLTGDTNIVEVQANVRYRVVDPVAWLYGVSDGSGGRSRAFALRKLGEAALTRLVARVSVDDVLASGRAALQIAVRDEVQRGAEALGLGVSITGVEVRDTAPPLMVDGAFKDVISANADRERQIDDARQFARRLASETNAERTRRLRAADSYAAEAVGAARGAAGALTSVLDEISGPDDPAARRLVLETLGRVLAKYDVRVVQPGEDGRPTWVVLDD